MSSLVLTFTPPTTAPANGYLVKYRETGTVPYTTVTPNQSSSPITVTGVDGTKIYEGTITADCGSGRTSSTTNFFFNERQHQVFTKTGCPSGQSGTTVDYVVPINTFSSTVSTADANNKALADITANGQTYANSHGSCILDTLISTLLIDYYDDSTVDLVCYCDTVGVTESNNIVTSTANGGPLMFPNDGRDPGTAYLLASDKLPGTGRTKRRFGVNMAYFISNYPAIDVFTFRVKGRGATSQAISGIYALRDITQGHLTLSTFSPGYLIPGVSAASTADIRTYNSHITNGADGTGGIGIGSNVLTLTYTVSTNTIVPTTY